MRYFLAALVLGTVPCALSAQSPADTVVARSVYWTDPLADLLVRVSALVPAGFGAREVERIEREALGLNPYDPSARTSASFVHRVRFRGRLTTLDVDLTAVEIAHVDVRFRAPDTALIAAIREQVRAWHLDSLGPIERVRLTLAERIGRGGRTPALAISMETVDEFGCLGYEIDHDYAQRGDTLYLELYGISAPTGLCPTLFGPAILSREIRIAPGRYTLVIDHRGTSDRFSVQVTDSSTALTAVQATFVEADERLRWRYPRNSFVVYCSNVEVAQAVCDDVERWLARQPGLSPLNFGPQGFNPYLSDRPAEQAGYFHYEDERALVPVRRCFAAVEGRIRAAVGVTLTLETWTGEELRAWSRRARHEPHIETPREVTTDPRCEGSD